MVGIRTLVCNLHAIIHTKPFPYFSMNLPQVTHNKNNVQISYCNLKIVQLTFP